MDAIRILAPHHLESAVVGELEDVELIAIALHRFDEVCQASDAPVVDAFHDGLTGRQPEPPFDLLAIERPGRLTVLAGSRSWLSDGGLAV